MARQRHRGRASKALSPGQGFVELGSTGLKQRGGKITDEIANILKTPQKRYKMYREIRDNSAPIGAARLAIEQLLRQTPIRVSAGADDPGSMRAFDLVKTAIGDMSRSWGDTMAQQLTMLDFGFAPMEIVYKRRGGDQRDPKKRSRFSDGLVGWRKIVLRPQQTVDRWEFGDDGSVSGMWQADANGGKSVLIPIEKMLLLRTRDEGAPEGRSLYRNCVFPWIFAKRLSEVEAVGIERDLTGIPVMGVPEEVLAEDAPANLVAVRDSCEKMITSLHRNENEGILKPLSYDAAGNERFTIELLTTGGRRAFDVGAVVQRYEQRMLMCLLADFILLGHERVGSFSLSSDKTDLFAVAIGAWLDSILEVWNRFAIPRLMEMNSMSGEPPVLKHGDIEKRDLADLGSFLVSVANAGINLDDEDGSLSRFVLDQAGLPVPPVSDDEATVEIGKAAPPPLFAGMVREIREIRKSLREAA